MHGMMGPPCAVADVSQRSSDHSHRYSRLLRDAQSGRRICSASPRIKCSRALPRSVRQLRPHGRRRCRRRRRFACRARWANRCASNGCAKTNMVGSPKGRRSWIFVTCRRRRRWQDHRLGICRSRISPHRLFRPRTPLAGVAPTRHETDGGRRIPTAPAAAAKCMRSIIKNAAAPLIAWQQADETPLRTGYLRAPGDMARCLRQRIVHR